MAGETNASEPFSCMWTQGGSEYRIVVADGGLELTRDGTLLIATRNRETFEWIFRIVELHRALERAHADLADWGGYVPSWAATKHNLRGDLEAIEEVLQVHR